MMEIIFKNPLFICTGEPSGDMYAGLLVKNLKKKIPHVKIYGVGGEDMQNSGVEVVESYRGLMTFGFLAGIFSLVKNYKFYRKIIKKIYQIRPKTFIAIAYPGLNLLLCRYAKKLGCRVYYFLPPQIWAWGSYRKYFIKKWVDKVISVFPFEYEFYKKIGIETLYFENPLIEKLKQYKRTDFKKRIGFMPGSRKNQIERNLPIIFELMRKIRHIRRNVEFGLILHSNSLKLIENVIARSPLERTTKQSQNKQITITGRAVTRNGFLDKSIPYFKVIKDNRYQAMKNCDVLITSSGTASLEAAFMNIPQIFFYRPSFFDFHFFKRFLKIKEYNLTHIYFNTQIVPNCIFYNKNYLLQNLFRLLNNYLF